MITEEHLVNLQARIDRRTRRFAQASRYLAELNASGVERSEEFIDRISRNFQKADEGLRMARDELRYILSSDDTTLITEQTPNTADRDKIIVTANIELLRFLNANPQHLHNLSGRMFEEVIGGIFHDLGYTVELTPVSHDGGKDLILRSDGPLGSNVAYVQCKRYSPLRPVGIEVVRALHGVHCTDRINKSMIVTTSYFTHEATNFARGLAFLISLKNFNDVVHWLSRFK